MCSVSIFLMQYINLDVLYVTFIKPTECLYSDSTKELFIFPKRYFKLHNWNNFNLLYDRMLSHDNKIKFVSYDTSKNIPSWNRYVCTIYLIFDWHFFAVRKFKTFQYVEPWYWTWLYNQYLDCLQYYKHRVKWFNRMLLNLTIGYIYIAMWSCNQHNYV